MNLASINLNLLVAFDALVAERHVTRAARRLGVTQSAMSNSLRQLRALFDDPLFLRAPRGVTPTARAVELGPVIHEGLQRLQSALGEQRFDPRTAERRFVVLASDFVQLVILPSLLSELAKKAPGVRVEVRGWTRHAVPEALASGDADLALGYFDRVPAKHRYSVLFEEPYVCIVRKGHPHVGKRLDAKTWASIPHVVVSESSEAGPTRVDAALAAKGLKRSIALRVSHFLIVPPIVAASDLSAAIDRRVALAFRLPLAIFPPPVPLPRGRVAMVWHERGARDPGLDWLRGAIHGAARVSPPRRVHARGERATAAPHSRGKES